jgi:uncharacterized membrane protein YkvA (DUF1232 family)
MKLKTTLKWILYMGGIVAFLSYLFMGTDLIPDTMPGLGFLDDAILAVLLIFGAGWAVKKFKLGEKKR